MKKFLLPLFLGATVFVSCNPGASKEQSKEKTATTDMTVVADKFEKATLGVQGACNMCKDRIEGAASEVDGVSAAVWDLNKNELSIEFDSSKTSLDAISKAVAAVGHDTEMDKASDSVYDALPGCCKYRK